MRRQSTTYIAPANAGVDYFQNQIPTDSPAALQTLAQQYQQAYQGKAPGYHPVLAGLAGFLGAGPVGAIIGPLSEQRKAANYKAGLLQQFPQGVEQYLKNAKAAQDYQAPLNDTDLVASTGHQMIDKGQINPNTVLPAQGRAYSKEMLGQFYNNMITPAALNSLNSAINTQQQQSYGMPSGTSFGSNGNSQMSPAAQMLMGHLTKQTQGIAPENLPLAMDPAVFGHVAQAQASAATNGLTEGEKRYEFGITSPHENALKDAQAAAQRADAVFTAGPKTRQANAGAFKDNAMGNAYNRGPGIGSYAPQPTTTTEIRSLYLHGAYGAPNSPEAMQAYSDALTRANNGTDSQTVYTDKDGNVIYTSNTVRNPRRPFTGGPLPAGVAPTGRPFTGKLSSQGQALARKYGLQPH